MDFSIMMEAIIFIQENNGMDEISIGKVKEGIWYLEHPLVGICLFKIQP